MAGKRKAYKTDLTDEQWELIRPFVEVEQTSGRPREVDLREVVNTLRYIEKTGVQWDMLPHDLPAKSTVYDYHRRWAHDGTWDRLLAFLNPTARKKKGREVSPSLLITDSQSAKTAQGGEEVGLDGFKKVKGRKRHILSDTLGLIWSVHITAANATDDSALFPLIDSLPPTDRLRKILGDGAYGLRNFPERFFERFENRIELEISKRPPDQRAFVPVKTRWIVERCFAWLNNSRRLSKDYERTVASSKAFVQIAAMRRAFSIISSPSGRASNVLG